MGWIHDGIDDGEPMPSRYALGAGQRFEIGDSVSGMQRHDMMGAAQLKALQARLGQNLQDLLRASSARDEERSESVPRLGEISINVSQTIVVAAATFVAGGYTPVSVSGFSTVYTSFKPNRIVMTEQVLATFTSSGTTATVTGESQTAGISPPGGRVLGKV